MLCDITEKVISILKTHIEGSLYWESFKLDDDLSNIGLNSVTFIKFVVSAEKEFEIVWENEDLKFDNFSTINKIANYISEKINS